VAELCVGKIYQQTFIDTYPRVAFAKVYDRKTAITAADHLSKSQGYKNSSSAALN
jgi:hypothetical protein